MQAGIQDRILHVSLMGGQVMVLIASTKNMCEDARRTHSLSRVATAALGRTLTVTAMMGDALKNDGDNMTTTIKGDGPIGTIVTVAKRHGIVKGYVDRPRVELPLKPNGKLDVGGAVGTGMMTIVKDLGFGDPYIAQLELVSGEIAQDFTYYFAVSEQQPSLVSLGVLTNGEVQAAGGLIIQPMPGCSEGVLLLLEMRTELYANISNQLLHSSLEQLIEEYFEGLAPEILSESRPAFQCDCNRDKLERIVMSLGVNEIEDIIATQGGAQLECHFCNAKYKFSAMELGQLIHEGTS